MLVNETFAKESGWTPEEAVGKTLKSGTRWEDKIIGVIKDFHLVSLHHRIEPLVFRHIVGGNQLLIKTKTDNYQELLKSIDEVWQEVTGVDQAEFTFLDKHFQEQYEKDEKRAEIFAGFSILIIFISLSGLFGLTSFAVQRRLKEMSIRKVHGASTRHLLTLMTKEYGVLSLLATAIALPIGYLVFDKWLEHFAYAIDLKLIYLTLPAIILIVLILATAVIRSYKVARVNPAEILRDE